MHTGNTSWPHEFVELIWSKSAFVGDNSLERFLRHILVLSNCVQLKHQCLFNLYIHWQNQTISTLSIGITYRLADVYLIHIPRLLLLLLRFQCVHTEIIVTPIACEFTIVDRQLSLITLACQCHFKPISYVST